MPYQNFRNPIKNYGFAHQCMKWHASTLLVSDIYIQQYKTEYWLISYWITEGNISPKLICSGDGLMPDGTKPLPGPMLTNHWWSLVAFTKSNFTENEQDTYLWDVFVKYKFNITTASPRGQWVDSLILKLKLCVILHIKICVKLIFLAPFAY